jgi:DNA polymerase-3 subunit epsilon
VRASADEVDPTLWLKVDSYSLLQALAYLAGRLADEHGVHSVRLRLQPAGTRARLDLVWAGQAMSTETVMNWQVEAMRSGEDATPLTVRDVVERHGGEFWFERERVRHEAFFRFLLPRSDAEGRHEAAPSAGQDSRPEFYDFDLFQTSAQARAFDERSLVELSYTVFDTETTGLNPSEGDEIIQIGALRIVNGRLLRQECFEQLVDPRHPLDAASAAIHGIRPEALAGQPTILEVLPVFHAFARDTVLVAHNAAFDMRFLQLKEAASGLRFEQPVPTPCCCRPGCSQTRVAPPGGDRRADGRGRHRPPHGTRRCHGDGRSVPQTDRVVAGQGRHTLGQARVAALQTYRARLRY